MRNQSNLPSNSQSENKQFQTQYKKTFEGFFKQPYTMKELSVAIGVDRANICRYCRIMRKAGTIAIVKKTYCRITKHLANRYTTNPEFFPKQSQLKLF